MWGWLERRDGGVLSGYNHRRCGFWKNSGESPHSFLEEEVRGGGRRDRELKEMGRMAKERESVVGTQSWCLGKAEQMHACHIVVTQ